MSKRKRIPVEEFEKLLMKADAIRVDDGALLSDWYTSSDYLLMAKESTYEGEVWEYSIDRSSVDIYARGPSNPDKEPAGLAEFVICEEGSEKELYSIHLYTLNPIIYEVKEPKQ